MRDGEEAIGPGEKGTSSALAGGARGEARGAGEETGDGVRKERRGEERIIAECMTSSGLCETVSTKYGKHECRGITARSIYMDARTWEGQEGVVGTRSGRLTRSGYDTI